MAGELIWILGAAILDAGLGFAGVFSLWISKKNLTEISAILMAFAAGSLLGGAFLHLLPEAMENLDTEQAFLMTLIGFSLFILLEAYVHWHHCKECEIHPFSYVMLVGDGVHNFIGGLVLTASFLVSIPLGIATIVAIVAHELPQQLGIFGVLIKGGLKRDKALLYSFAAQSTIILGALVGYFLSGIVGGIAIFLVPFAAGNFIYIAASDLIPEMHKSEGLEKIRNIVVFIVGILFMWALKIYGAG
ncbi:ZIP family metal transporter [Candidatus Micrarchaeota archaeon]|nr:ZIP family metal transporter [Candidatus Micrarchaeota archaeon]MBU1165796.1 ZIP family metal transporter [Candidatus Micrarchaeota archaeon]